MDSVDMSVLIGLILVSVGLSPTPGNGQMQTERDGRVTVYERGDDGKTTAKTVPTAPTFPMVEMNPEELAETERFMYWTECSPLGLFVFADPGNEDVVRMGLTEEDIATAVRSRLRAARLYAGMNNREVPQLMIAVRVVNSKIRTGGAVSINVGLFKHLYDPLSSFSSLAQTNPLFDSAIGLHAGKPAFVLSQIGQMMDGFLDTYLRVNEPACY